MNRLIPGSLVPGTLATLIALLIPWPLAAQTVSPRELPAYAEPGDLVTLIDGRGDKMTGRIETLDASAITLTVAGGHRHAVPFDTVSRVVVKDSVLNGALIGLVAGAVPGVLFGVGWTTYCSNEATTCPAAPLIFGALFAGAGAGIGAGIDGLIHRRLTIAPVVGPARQGMALSIRF